MLKQYGVGLRQMKENAILVKMYILIEVDNSTHCFLTYLKLTRYVYMQVITLPGTKYPHKIQQLKW